MSQYLVFHAITNCFSFNLAFILLVLVLICIKNLGHHGMSNDQFGVFCFVVFKISSSVYSEIDSFTVLTLVILALSHDLVLYLGPSALEGKIPSILLFLK